MLKDILFPRFCVGCGALGNYICRSCQKKLIAVKEDICFYCKKRSYLGWTHPGCKRKGGMDGFLCAFFYNPLMKKIIKNIKYRLAKDIFKDLSASLPMEFIFKISSLGKFNSGWYLQAVPLHSEKIRLRGFNQSDIIKDQLSGFIKGSHSADVLKRIKNTPSQAQLKNKKQKYLNVQGAFKPGDRVEITGKDFILVDDVITTGSTAKEACRILKSNGAGKVFVITLARG